MLLKTKEKKLRATVNGFDYDRYSRIINFTPLFTSSIALKCNECNSYAAINSLSDWWRRSSGWNDSFRLSESPRFLSFHQFRFGFELMWIFIFHAELDYSLFDWENRFPANLSVCEREEIDMENTFLAPNINTRLCTTMRAHSVHILRPKVSREKKHVLSTQWNPTLSQTMNSMTQ